MESLKGIIEILGLAGTTAIWALVIIYLYKVIIIGSIYGTVRFVVTKIHDIVVAPKKLKLGTIAIDESTAMSLAVQIARLGDKGCIQMNDVQQLREALDTYFERKIK